MGNEKGLSADYLNGFAREPLCVVAVAGNFEDFPTGQFFQKTGVNQVVSQMDEVIKIPCLFKGLEAEGMVAVSIRKHENFHRLIVTEGPVPLKRFSGSVLP